LGTAKRKAVPMIAEIFGLDGIITLFFTLLFLAVFVLIIISVVQVARAPGLTVGAKWAWSLGMVIGYWLFWLPGVVVMVTSQLMKKRWTHPRLY
jgi:hypothetical protein